MTVDQIFTELLENIEEFDGQAKRYIKSVWRFYKSRKFVTESQMEYLHIYYKQLKNLIGDN